MDSDELYQEVILDHCRRPRNRTPLADADVLVDDENPTCGDHIRLAARIEDGVVHDLRYDGKGCAISTASASLMSEELNGMPVAEARALIHRFIEWIRGESDASAEDFEDLAALGEVKAFPMRIKCATLAWHAAQKALDKLDADR